MMEGAREGMRLGSEQKPAAPMQCSRFQPLLEKQGRVLLLLSSCQLLVSGLVFCWRFSQWNDWEPLDAAPELPLHVLLDPCTSDRVSPGG